MIPVATDVDRILSDLHWIGWCDYKIEAACGLSAGFLYQWRRRGPATRMLEENAARLYNFWFDERHRHDPGDRRFVAIETPYGMAYIRP